MSTNNSEVIVDGIDAKTKMAVARRLITKNAPYLSTAIYFMPTREVPELPTMAVTHDGIMLWSKKDVNRLSKSQCAASIAHEALHLVMRHNHRAKSKMVPDERRPIWNYAADFVINRMLEQMRFDVRNDQFVHADQFGLPLDKTVEWYYDELIKVAQEKKKQMGKKCCGSGAGNKSEHEPKPKGDGTQQQDGSGGRQGERPESGDGESGGRDEASIQMMSNTVAKQVLEQQQKAAGSVPNGLAMWAGEQVKPPTIDWRSHLKNACRALTTQVQGETDRTYTKQHKFQAALGYGNNAPILGKYIAFKPRIRVALDTSGSMMGQTMLNAISEVIGVMKAVNAPLEFMSIDCELQAAGTIKTVEDLRKLVKGGGGTDFNPIFEHIAADRDKTDALIIITDGYGPAPAAPPNYPVIWVLIGHSTRPVTWGKYIEIKEERR